MCMWSGAATEAKLFLKRSKRRQRELLDLAVSCNVIESSWGGGTTWPA